MGGGVIGSKELVESIYQRFKHHFLTDKEKEPKTIRAWMVCIP